MVSRKLVKWRTALVNTERAFKKFNSFGAKLQMTFLVCFGFFCCFFFKLLLGKKFI